MLKTKFQNVLKSVMHVVSILKKECYNNNNYNNNLFPSHLQVSLTFFVMAL